jgi:hypothetical protein
MLLLPLAADISGRMAILQRMHQEKARLDQELVAAREERDALKSELQSVGEDAYLEKWARVDARLTRPGEVAIIPLFIEQMPRSRLNLTEKPTLDGSSVSTADKWRRLFFDNLSTP